MNCKICGAEIAEGAKFCENCGHKVEVEAASVADQIKEEAFSEPERVDAEIVSEGERASQPLPDDETAYTAEDTQESVADDDYQSAPNAETVTRVEEQGPIGYSIASLVCGILGLLCCCCGFFGIIVSGAGVALGIVSIKKNCEGKGMAIAGIVCGGIGLLMTLIGMIIGGLSGSLSGISDLDDFSDSIGDLLESL